jgi:hypothetical protein
MRVLLGSLAAPVLFLIAGCASVPPLPPEPPPPPPIEVEPQSSTDATPHVVRRLIHEAQEQVDKNREMAAELRDARGRVRAQNESNAIEVELNNLAARVDNADSDNLDDVMNRLHLLDTRIDLLHERLRAATDRTSLGAVSTE